MKFYIAAPFFNDEELEHVKNIEKILEDRGHQMFSPRLNQLPQFEYASFEWRTNIFRNDINHLKWCDAVIAILGDNYDDTGTAFEVGFAYAIGRPVYLYNPTGNIINLMITDAIHGYFETLDEVIDYDFELAPAKPYMKKIKDI